MHHERRLAKAGRACEGVIAQPLRPREYRVAVSPLRYATAVRVEVVVQEFRVRPVHCRPRVGGACGGNGIQDSVALVPLGGPAADRRERRDAPPPIYLSAAVDGLGELGIVEPGSDKGDRPHSFIGGSFLSGIAGARADAKQTDAAAVNGPARGKEVHGAANVLDLLPGRLEMTRLALALPVASEIER